MGKTCESMPFHIEIPHYSGLFQRPYAVTFRNVSCVALQPKILDFQITLTTDEDDVQRISGNLDIKEVIPEIFLHMTVLLDSGNENFDLLYLNKTISVCKFLENKKSNVFLGIAYEATSVYVDLPKRCPLVKV